MSYRSRTALILAVSFFIAFISVSVPTLVQAEGELIWAKRAGGSEHDWGFGIAALSGGGALVTGRFSDTAVFGAGEIGEATLISGGIGPLYSDIFVAKYNPDGTLAWAKRAGGGGQNWGEGVSVLPDGGAFVTGKFVRSATFGPGETNETVLDSQGELDSDDIFVARYNPDGTLAWAKQAGLNGNGWGMSIAVLPEGSSFVTGWFSGTATFGPGEPGQTLLTSFGSSDIFVAKYNSDGTLAWVKQAGNASGWGWGYSIVVLSDGSAFITGRIYQWVTFGPGEGGETTLGWAGGEDLFVARYHPDGSLAWASDAGGALNDRGHGIAVLPDGSTLVTGIWEFNDSATVGDLLLMKYNPDGSLAWTRQDGGTSFDQGYAVAALPDGSALITGSFSGTATFGQGESGEISLVSEGGTGDIFVAGYHPDGTFAWARRAGGVGDDRGQSIAPAPDDSILVTGWFNDATFGPDESRETFLDTNSQDVFIAKFSMTAPISGDVIYCYDGLSRLTDCLFRNGRIITYAHDPTGNRTAKTVTSQVLASLGPSSGPIADVTASQTGVGMLQLRLTVDKSEDVVLNQIRFEGAGTGNEIDHLSGASLYLDTDHDGLLSAPDIALATDRQFNADDGFLSFSGFSHPLGGDSDHDLLVTYDLNGAASNGDSFALSWTQNGHVEITGASSGNALLPLGAPVYGATKTIQSIASTPLPTNTPTDTPTVTPTATATWTPTPTNIPPTPPPNTPSPPDLAMGVLDVSPALSLPAASDDDGFIVDYFFVLWREEPGPQGTPTVADYRSGFTGRPTPVFQPSEALIRGTTYYWRARAFDDGGDPSVYTSLFRFQLATETPTPTPTSTANPVDRWRQY